MKNKDKYNLKDLRFVSIYTPCWSLYKIEVRKRKPDDSDSLNDGELYAVIEARKPELDAIMEWLESEEKHI